MTRLGQWFSVERHRAWLYRVSLAIIALLIGLGVLADEQGPLLIGLAAAMFPIGTAVANTTTTKAQDQPPPTP